GVRTGVAGGLVEGEVVGVAVAAVLRVVGADDGLQAFAQRNPGGAVGALHPLVEDRVDRGIAPRRFGDRVGSVREAGQGPPRGGREVRAAFAAGRFAAGDAGTEHRLLFAAEQLEAA